MKILSWSAVASLGAWSVSAFAAQVYVEPATGTGVTDSDLAAATSLIQSSVPEVSSHTVVNQPSGADIVLRPKLLRLGNAYILSLAKVEGGQQVSSSQLKAKEIDELDKVAERLTRSVLVGEKAAENPRVGEITNQEASDGTQRRPVRKQVYLGFGGSNFGNLNATGWGYSFGAAYTWDTNRVRIKLLGEGDVNGAAFFTSGGIGASYFLTTTDVAPYVGGDFGAGAAKIDGGGVFSGSVVGGFVIGLAAGAELLRTSSINLDLGFRAGFLLHANQYGTPEVLSLRLGLYF